MELLKSKVHPNVYIYLISAHIHIQTHIQTHIYTMQCGTCVIRDCSRLCYVIILFDMTPLLKCYALLRNVVYSHQIYHKR